MATGPAVLAALALVVRLGKVERLVPPITELVPPMASVPVPPPATLPPLLVKLPPTLSVPPLASVSTELMFSVTKRACWALLTVGWLGVPPGMVTSLLAMGTMAGVQLAAVPQSVLTLPFQVRALPLLMYAAR